MKNKFLFLTPFLLTSLFSFAQTNQDFVFATMETEHATFLQKQQPDSIKILSSKDNLSAIYFHPSIAEHLQGKFAHGHGYIFQNSEEEALQEIQQIVFQKKAPFNYSITEQNFITKALDDVDVKEIEKTILLLEGFKTRYHTRQEANDAILKLKEVWERMIADAGRTDVAVKLIDHVNTPMKSLILTMNGNEKREEFVIIGGHADSTVGGGNQDNAPGADDNASGIATITEVLRVLLKNDFKPQRTIEIMAYAAEEIGLVGSKEIAKQYATDQKNVIGYVQFDMTNYKGSAKDVVLMTDTYCDTNLNSFLMKLMDEYNQSGLHQFTYDTSKCGYGCSDHASWANNGFAATLPFEAKMNEDNPYIHTINDTYATMGNTSSHAAKFTKLGIEYIVEAAKQTSGLGVETIEKETSKIYITDKTLTYQLNFTSPISLKIIDANGRTIKKLNTEQSNGSVNLSNLSTGFYIVTIHDNKGKSISHKFVLK